MSFIGIETEPKLRFVKKAKEKRNSKNPKVPRYVLDVFKFVFV